MLIVSDITIAEIKNGNLENDLPELFALKDCIENNGWHNDDPVFDHTIAVLEDFEKTIKRTNDNLKYYLEQRVDTHSKEELLRLAILFHDIAKNDTIIRKGNHTSCPNHEAAGAEKAQEILNRFTLIKKEKVLVTKLIMEKYILF